MREGSIFLLAFVLPFGLLAIGFARLPWSRRALLGLYGALAATALAYAASGVFQWATRDVFWNPRVIVGNAYAPFYRVNSVFWDPSIYGRYLVVAILATLALVLLGVRTRWLAGGIALIAATWAGLLFSFSQSSFVGARGGDARCRHDRLALARGRRARARRRRAGLGRLRDAAGADQAPARVQGRAELGHERPGGARLERPADRGRPPGRGRRRRRLQACLRRPHGAARQGAEEGGLALDARHRRRGGGRSRCRPARAGSPSPRSAGPTGAAAGPMPDASHSSLGLRLARSPCTASSTTRSSRIPRPGRCSAWWRSPERGGVEEARSD